MYFSMLSDSISSSLMPFPEVRNLQYTNHNAPLEIQIPFYSVFC